MEISSDLLYMAPRVGFEPTTPRLTAAYSTVELSRIITPGNDLCFQGPASQVLSAQESLTAVFGMGTGVASPLKSPGKMRTKLDKEQIPFFENRKGNKEILSHTKVKPSTY